MTMYFTPYFRLTFNEANILMENIKEKDRTELLLQLEVLYKNASDEILSKSALSLLKKIAVLSEDEYARLTDDATQGKILYPPNYSIN